MKVSEVPEGWRDLDKGHVMNRQGDSTCSALGVTEHGSFIRVLSEGLQWPATMPGGRDADVVRQCSCCPRSALHKDQSGNCQKGEVQNVPREYTLEELAACR